MNKLISLKKLSKIVNGVLIGNNIKILNFTINSKKIKKNCIFIAIHGKKYDGHSFITEAIQNGALAILVNKFFDINISQIIVSDTILALGQLGLWKRTQFNNPVIGITGSSGKTSVKEMTISILKKKYKIIFTKKNMNNHIGIPLTLLNMTNKHQCAVIEIGGNQINDISYSTSLVKPNIAIINNISEAHLEGFKSLKNIIKCKISIFNYLTNKGTAIFNYDDINQKKILKHLTNNYNILTFSLYNKKTNFFTKNIKIFSHKIIFTLISPIGEILIKLFLIGGGIHNINNALASAALSFSIGCSLKEIANGLKYFRPVPGRMFPIIIDNNKLIINDTYNANPNSVIIAINILQNFKSTKILIIGDMLELGMYTIYFHKKIKNLILQTNIDYIFSFGKYSKYITENNINAKHFINKTKLINKLFLIIKKLKNYTILFKGSRNNKMEILINILLEKLKCY
ncbi:UDP-N-acetylmuramoyl-tripeptide--D-alanyl-D-alanine ligase [Enterobacteriaceae endosymbiont of Donacia bicoloricornis]|uniref:UDP-N-acetylmuramoyl-tripeptide--D-alanyl-D- alanine ligase n=1 Tax=Enterobacteriaceae endosymbiont of Donacia bicoloricornis TaxID=2675772 RepID=UPI0014498F93|nr:UDP-N-acetylmuramoyl-tripeptide--D-alanyl-D-alanine ligase [Enterobacteriaceae endosymbiont of Donacia bicoloricornis]QJC37674.1 UDP-N-acetylmuramoyl-tripeptide--D-alanyl-D-alanine ligase [Enterobacteriaceae endosymbiont of Donacia bicoloricornis]